MEAAQAARGGVVLVARHEDHRRADRDEHLGAGYDTFVPDADALYDQAQAAFGQDPAEGWRLLLAAGEAGHAAALREVGQAYLVGQHDLAPSGVPGANPARALAAFDRAIAAGDVGTMTYLADLLTEETMLPRDDARALALYEQAAALGSAEAAFWLGRAYAEGDQFGLAPDAAGALRWLGRAAAAEDVIIARQAATILAGVHLWAGHARDEARAYALAMRAEADGATYASAVIAPMLELGLGTAPRPEEALARYRAMDGHGRPIAFALAHAGAPLPAASAPTAPDEALDGVLPTVAEEPFALMMAVDRLFDLGAAHPAWATVLPLLARDQNGFHRTLVALFREHGVFGPRDVDDAVARYRAEAARSPDLASFARYRLLFLAGDGPVRLIT